MLPKILKHHHCPKRHRLLELLVSSIPTLLDRGSTGAGTVSNPVEDHHAIMDLQEILGCDVAEAKLLLKLAIEEFPSLKVYMTGAL